MREDSLPREADEAADEDSGAYKEGRSARGFVGASGCLLTGAFERAGAHLCDRFARDDCGSFLVHLMSESVFLKLVEKGFITDTKIFRRLTLVAHVCFQHANYFLSLDQAKSDGPPRRECRRDRSG